MIPPLTVSNPVDRVTPSVAVDPIRKIKTASPLLGHKVIKCNKEEEHGFNKSIEFNKPDYSLKRSASQKDRSFIIQKKTSRKDVTKKLELKVEDKPIVLIQVEDKPILILPRSRYSEKKSANGTLISHDTCGVEEDIEMIHTSNLEMLRLQVLLAFSLENSAALKEKNLSDKQRNLVKLFAMILKKMNSQQIINNLPLIEEIGKYCEELKDVSSPYCQKASLEKILSKVREVFSVKSSATLEDKNLSDKQRNLVKFFAMILEKMNSQQIINNLPLIEEIGKYCEELKDIYFSYCLKIVLDQILSQVQEAFSVKNSATLEEKNLLEEQRSLVEHFAGTLEKMNSQQIIKNLPLIEEIGKHCEELKDIYFSYRQKVVLDQILSQVQEAFSVKNLATLEEKNLSNEQRSLVELFAGTLEKMNSQQIINNRLLIKEIEKHWKGLKDISSSYRHKASLEKILSQVREAFSVKNSAALEGKNLSDEQRSLVERFAKRTLEKMNSQQIMNNLSLIEEIGKHCEELKDISSSCRQKVVLDKVLSKVRKAFSVKNSTTLEEKNLSDEQRSLVKRFARNLEKMNSQQIINNLPLIKEIEKHCEELKDLSSSYRHKAGAVKLMESYCQKEDLDEVVLFCHPWLTSTNHLCDRIYQMVFKEENTMDQNLKLMQLYNKILSNSNLYPITSYKSMQELCRCLREFPNSEDWNKMKEEIYNKAAPIIKSLHHSFPQKTRRKRSSSSKQSKSSISSQPSLKILSTDSNAQVEKNKKTPMDDLLITSSKSHNCASTAITAQTLIFDKQSRGKQSQQQIAPDSSMGIVDKKTSLNQTLNEPPHPRLKSLKGSHSFTEINGKTLKSHSDDNLEKMIAQRSAPYKFSLKKDRRKASKEEAKCTQSSKRNTTLEIANSVEYDKLARMANKEIFLHKISADQSDNLHKAIIHDKVEDSVIHSLAWDLKKIEAELFSQILPSEFPAYLEKRYRESPTIVAYTHHSNILTYSVSSHILSYKTSQKRAACIKFYIRLAKESKEIGNFNGAFFMFSALQHPSISRLKKTWAKIDKNTSEENKKLIGFFSPFDNFGNYRKCIEEWEKYEINDAACCVIPLFSLYLREFTIINENFPTYKKGHLDLDKLKSFAHLHTTMQKYQKFLFSFKEELLNKNYTYNLCELLESQKEEVKKDYNGDIDQATADLYLLSSVLK
jgi:adenylate kinase